MWQPSFWNASDIALLTSSLRATVISKTVRTNVIINQARVQECPCNAVARTASYNYSRDTMEYNKIKNCQ